MYERIKKDTDSTNLAKYEALIEQHQVFCLLDRDNVHQLARLAKTANFAENDIIVKEGDTVRYIYIIISGTAEVSRQIKNAFKEEIMQVAILTTGDAIGLSAANFFSLSGIRTATVKAISPVTAMQFDLRDFYRFLDNSDISYPGLKNYIEKFLVAELIVNTHLFTDLNKLKIQHIAMNVKKIFIKANEIIYEKIDVPNKYFCLFSGKVSIYKLNDNKENLIEAFEGICFFDESNSFTEAKTCRIVMRSSTDCVLLVLDRRDYMQYLRKENTLFAILRKWLRKF